MLFKRKDGTHYGFHHYYLQFTGPGFSHQRIQGGFEDETGQTVKVIGMTPTLRFESPSKRLQGGEKKQELHLW